MAELKLTPPPGHNCAWEEKEKARRQYDMMMARITINKRTLAYYIWPNTVECFFLVVTMYAITCFYLAELETDSPASAAYIQYRSIS